MAAHDRGCLSILGARQRDLLRVGDQSGCGPPAAPCPSGARRLVGLVALMLAGRCATLLLPFDLIDCLSPITGSSRIRASGFSTWHRVRTLPAPRWGCDRDPYGENDSA